MPVPAAASSSCGQLSEPSLPAGTWCRCVSPTEALVTASGGYCKPSMFCDPQLSQRYASLQFRTVISGPEGVNRKAGVGSSPAGKHSLILDGRSSSIKKHKLSLPEGDLEQETALFYSRDKGTCMSKTLLVALCSCEGNEMGWHKLESSPVGALSVKKASTCKLAGSKTSYPMGTLCRAAPQIPMHRPTTSPERFPGFMQVLLYVLLPRSYSCALEAAVKSICPTRAPAPASLLSN